MIMWFDSIFFLDLDDVFGSYCRGRSHGKIPGCGVVHGDGREDGGAVGGEGSGGDARNLQKKQCGASICDFSLVNAILVRPSPFPLRRHVRSRGISGDFRRSCIRL